MVISFCISNGISSSIPIRNIVRFIYFMRYVFFVHCILIFDKFHNFLVIQGLFLLECFKRINGNNS